MLSFLVRDEAKVCFKKSSNLKIIYFVTVDWFFLSHFIDRAKFIKAAGFEVLVICKFERCRSLIEAEGIRCIPLDLSRKSINPIQMLRLVFNLKKIYRIERPALVHQVALKPILIGTLAAKFSSGISILNAPVGMGYIFTSNSIKALFLRPFVNFALRLLMNPNGSYVVFENSDDRNFLIQKGFVQPSKSWLIKGAGVNIKDYNLRLQSDHREVVIVLPARLLWDKGIGDFVNAAKIILDKGLNARFVVVGGHDHHNASNIDSRIIDDWNSKGPVEFWGFQKDMKKIFSLFDIVCLPSYREGLPKALLEGMAAGLPCVTTNVPGCREVVKNEDNGYLVPPRNPQALADAIQKLILDADLRRKMGMKGRQRILSEFSSKIICEKTFELYKEILKIHCLQI
jgi:glycosyltransferase involved in cell wall biosynthesis